MDVRSTSRGRALAWCMGDRRGERVVTPSLTILFQDADLLVVDKPSGLLVHRGWGSDKVVAMTLARSLVNRHVYPVHRLDRGTSGVLVFALTLEAARVVCASFERGQVAKRYVALVRGVAPEECVIDHPLPRGEAGGERVPAVTLVRRLHVLDRTSLVEARPRTGRLHQVRRHLKHLGHPIIGDVNYGKGELNRLFRAQFGLFRIALHASAIALAHPTTEETMTFAATVPEDLRGPLVQMGIPPQLLAP